MNHHNIICKLSIVILSVAISACVQEQPEIIQASRTEFPLKIDGLLNEPVWQRAGQLVLLDNQNGEAVTDSLAATVAKLAYDDRYLYIAFSCADLDIFSSFTGRDEHLWEEEVVEVFIETDDNPDTYVEIEIAPTNVQFDSYIVDPQNIDLVETPRFDIPGLLSAVAVEGTLNQRDDVDRRWTVEMAVPFKDLKTAFKVEDFQTARWKLNMYRIDGDDHGPKSYALSPTHGRFHKPESFLTMTFEDRNTLVAWNRNSENGMVVAGKRQAVAAGVDILSNGGNAVDAAVAATLVLSVTHIGAFCIGGEVPFIVYDAETGDTRVLSGQGAAPLDENSMKWYYRNGIPGSDIKAAAVPAVIDLCVTALQQYGTRSFAETAAPLLSILDAGGPNWYRDSASGDTIDGVTGKSISSSDAATPVSEQSWYADLAGTLSRLIEAEQRQQGDRVAKLQAVADRFYRGDIADELEKWYIEKGGFLRKRDLATHRTLVEEPLEVNYRGYTVYKCGPWTQGPYLLEALRLLDGYDLKSMGMLSADYIHVITEAMKLALADRDEYYADPRFVDVPMEALLSDAYTNVRKPLIDMATSSKEIRPGDPVKLIPVIQTRQPLGDLGGTTTLCVADRWGNVVAATPSGLGSDAGSGGHTGITHATRLQSLNTWRKHPNRIQPGKRPRITLTPTLVMKDGKPVVAISIAGGDLQDQVALQLLLDYIEFGMLPEAAVSAPRFATNHHTGSFGQDAPRLRSLRISDGVSEKVREALAGRGHQLRVTSGGIGGAAMLLVDPSSGLEYGAGSAWGSVPK